MPAFEELGLAPEILRAVEEMGWLLPSDIQDEAIPLILGGGDAMAAAQTGSGKTGAFGLPILQVVHEVRNLKLDFKSEGGRGAAVSSADGSARGSGGSGSSSGGTLASGCRLSVEERDAVFSVSPSGLECQSRAPTAWCGGRATVGAEPPGVADWPAPCGETSGGGFGDERGVVLACERHAAHCS